MAGKHKTIPILQQAATMKAAGYSLASICSVLDISPSTAKRHLSSVIKGSIKDSAIKELQLDLLEDETFTTNLKSAINAHLLDDLHQLTSMREAIALNLEAITSDPSIPAVQVSRALAAISTSLALTQKASRIMLKVDDQLPPQQAYPELLISELTQGDIDLLKEQQDELSGLTSPSPTKPVESGSDLDSDVISEDG